MKIEINLENLESCDGCKLLRYDFEKGFKCDLYQIDIDMLLGKNGRLKRPTRCIEENGE